MSPGLVAGIALLAAGAILVILCVLCWKGCIRQKKEIHEDQISPVYDRALPRGSWWIGSHCYSKSHCYRVACCMSSTIGNVKDTKGVSLATVKKDRGGIIIDTDCTALTRNGKVQQEEMVVKEMLPRATLIARMGIVKFLGGKRFLITGATGFVAKVLIEKILRTAPDVGKIFQLMKAKNKKAAEERLENEELKHGHSFRSLGKQFSFQLVSSSS